MFSFLLRILKKNTTWNAEMFIICKPMKMVHLSAFECLISEMRGKAKLKLILFDSYILLNYRKVMQGKA